MIEAEFSFIEELFKFAWLSLIVYCLYWWLVALTEKVE